MQANKFTVCQDCGNSHGLDGKSKCNARLYKSNGFEFVQEKNGKVKIVGVLNDAVLGYVMKDSIGEIFFEPKETSFTADETATVLTFMRAFGGIGGL